MTSFSVGICAVGLVHPGGSLAALAFLDDALDLVVSPTAALALLAACVLLVTAWLVVLARTLTRRVRWTVLPSAEFDPSEEEVARFASSLGRCVKRGPTGRLGRSGCAVRVRLSSTGQGRMAYDLEVPGHAVSVVRSSSYSGVVLEDPSEVDLAVEAGRPASPEEGGRGGAPAPAETSAPPAEALEWAHAAEGGDVVEDWAHDHDPGGEQRR